MADYEIVRPKLPYHDGSSSWSARVRIGETEYWVGIERGKPVRIPYQPRGRNVGYEWFGFVREVNGRELMRGRSDKNAGIPTLLRRARILMKT